MSNNKATMPIVYAVGITFLSMIVISLCTLFFDIQLSNDTEHFIAINTRFIGGYS